MKRSAALQRKTPLRPAMPQRVQRDRSAEFATFVPRPRQPALRLVPRAEMPVVCRPKENAVRSEPYRRLVATCLPCILCGIEGHGQAAHGNAGKGMGIKADDRGCFNLCGPSGNDCHRRFDQGALYTKEQRREIEPLLGHATRMKLRKLAETDLKVRAVVERVIGL